MLESPLKLEVGLEVINSYKRLSYKQWYALAEYIDNSTQAYFNNKEVLDAAYKIEADKPSVWIEITKDGKSTTIKISDNSMGMSFDELEHAVVIGKPPIKSDGRSKYGLGMKTASFWLGDNWSVTTKKLGETVQHSVVINAQDLITNKGSLQYSKVENLEATKHYTIVEITDVHQPFTTNILTKVQNFIASMYRFDIMNDEIRIYFNKELLEWSYDDTFKKLKPMSDGSDRLKIEFDVESKKVTGWAGVLDEGASRSKAGFSIFVNNRIIKGWPESYKPASIFGTSGGRNDLINQRLVGELFLDGFEVSHTKDEIVFQGDEEEVLEYLLRQHTAVLNVLINEPKKKAKISSEDEEAINQALAYLELEFNSKAISTAYETYEVPDEELYELNKEVLINTVSGGTLPPKFDVKLGSLQVLVYLDGNISGAEPYLSIGIYPDAELLKVVINTTHPHFQQLALMEVVMNYVRHCVYDGVAEYKAYKYSPEEFKPDTIKSIKDMLLRASYTVKMD